jgi:hypothetical protein
MKIVIRTAHGKAGRLPMDGVAVRQGVFEQGHHGVDIILTHFPNVLEQKRHGLEDTILRVAQN